jgi:MoaA/NifB/PqqE/SkfB family radical SAM enzyme
MRVLDLIRILRMFAPAVGRLPAAHLWYLLGRMGNEKPHKFGKQIRVNTFFPTFPSQAFDRFLKAVIQRRRVPYSTYIAITSQCPFHCGHCSYGRRNPANLSQRQMMDIIGQVKAMGGATVGFTGGEPLLVPWLEELIAACSPEMATIVFTTGHGLDAPRAAALARAGLGCLTVGVESSDPALHDRVRGAKSFEEARLAVRTSLDAGLYTALSTIGTKEKIITGDLDRLYDLAASWGVGELRVLAPVASGGAAGCQAFMLSPENRQALYDFHVQRNRAGAGPAVASFAYLESQDMFGCGAGYHHLFIDAAGEVCPCDLTPLSMGNACQEPLREIWARMAEHFSKPRTHCLMGHVAALLLQGDATLPLPPETSERILSAIPHDGALPGAYKRLLK